MNMLFCFYMSDIRRFVFSVEKEARVNHIVSMSMSTDTYEVRNSSKTTAIISVDSLAHSLNKERNCGTYISQTCTR